MIETQQHHVRNGLLRRLTPEDFAVVQPHLHLIDLPTGEVLIQPHQPVEELYFLDGGIASITAAGSGGQVEVGLVGREGLVGAVPVILGSDRIPHEQFMQFGGAGWRITASALGGACAASRGLHRFLLRYVQTVIVQARQTAYVNASHTIETRLARWLLMCLDRIDGDELPVKHEFLGMMLGVQRSGVTLALQNLEGGRCIRSRRGRVQVLDRELLRAVADGSYGQPEAEYARLIEGQ